MRKLLSVAGLLGLACLLAGAGLVGTAGTSIFKLRADQTTSNTKIVEFQNGAASTVASVDKEGDIACHDLTVSGTFTLPATNFASGLTIATDAASFSSGGNLKVGTSGASNFTVAAGSGNTVIAGTAQIAGLATLTSGYVGGAASDITLNTDKFTVDATQGNTVIAGTLNVTGQVTMTAGYVGGTESDITLNTNKFTVDATNGNTLIAGTLTQGTALGASALVAVKGIMTFTSAATNMSEILTLAEGDQDVAVTGVAAGDACFLLTTSVAQDSGLVCDCLAASAKVTLRCYNATAGSIDPANKTYTFLILDLT